MCTIRDDAEDILNGLPLTAKEKKSYERVKTAFTQHCVSKHSMFFERAHFNRQTQEGGESVEAFITAVHVLSEHCEFEAVREELIRDRIVVGIHDARLSESLKLDPELTLAKTIAKVRKSKAVKRQQPMLHSSL